MASLHAIPSDLIRSKILHPHILANNPETPSLLAARATCIAFWRDLPIGMILGLKDETVKWLLKGTAHPWWPMANTAVNVQSADQHLIVNTRSSQWTNHAFCLSAFISNEDGSWATANITTPMGSSIPLIHIQAFDGDRGTVITDSAFFITAVIVHDGAFMIVSRLGTVYRLTIAQIMDDKTLPRAGFLRHISSKKTFSVLLHLEGNENRFQLKDVRTNDGDRFIFLTAYGNLLSGRCSQPSRRLTHIARGVNAFTIIDDALLCALDHGVITVISLRQRHTTAKMDVSGAKVKQFLTVPELKSVWFADESGRVFYKSGRLASAAMATSSQTESYF